ncbi:MAG TPA: antirestriction protein ArdA [Candidatus Baltobacteraceae bacterium]|nr:antirestriction protein ArdA [Candidatus Baltobacteraceae bacterium]
MTELHAQPYDISAQGFYFRTAAEYQEKAAKVRNDFGFSVEEFEIQFIDGDNIDAELFEALRVDQSTFPQFLEACDAWDEHQKRKVILAVGECGYSFDLKAGDPDDLDVDIYELDSLRDLAEHFVDEGLFGEIPTHLQHYIDYDAMARDLGMDYSEATVDGKRLVYRCA